MGELEKVNQAQLSSALTGPGGSLRKRLSTEDSSTLLALMNSLVKRYHTQDMTDPIEEYLLDYEAIAEKHGIVKVQKAIEALRVDPDQQFFPKPNEVAHEIKQQQLKSLPSHIYARG